MFNSKYHASLLLHDSYKPPVPFTRSRRQLSANSRARQLLLNNQAILNNLMSNSNIKSSFVLNSNRSNFSTDDLKLMSQLNSSRSSSNSNNVNIFIKKPFKHYKQNLTSSTSFKYNNNKQINSDSLSDRPKIDQQNLNYEENLEKVNYNKALRFIIKKKLYVKTN